MTLFAYPKEIMSSKSHVRTFCDPIKDGRDTE